MRAEDIIGTWQLLSWVQEYDHGEKVFPMGEHPVGYIAYSADGRMMTVVTAGDRPRFATGGQWDAVLEERAAAYDTCLAYGGRFEMTDVGVVHHVELSLFPNWVGNTQTRRAELRDGELHLTARLEEGTDQARTAVLSWRRAPGA